MAAFKNSEEELRRSGRRNVVRLRRGLWLGGGRPDRTGRQAACRAEAAEPPGAPAGRAPEVEHHATALRVAHVINIPGLLQTPDHARALFAQTVPPLKPHEIEHRVSHRVKRQEVLHREQPPPYTAIIHEAALRMRFGDRATTRGQLTRLVETSELGHVTLMVVPFETGPFHTSGQGFDYFHGPVSQLDTVQIDTDHGGELIDSPAPLERYRLVLDRMSATALDPAKSRDFITHLIKDL
ncbi:hypothetical protein GCM10010344_23730 [Streptomyces bluensis]|nr:hypothetical protein GCM10010344_23730 [Streptomyces bluensis]